MLKDIFQHFPWKVYSFSISCRSVIILNFFLYTVWGRSQELTFFCFSGFSSTICWKDFSFLNWITLTPLLKISCIYFWTFSSVPFIYSFILMLLPYCLDYCIFIASFEISSSILFFLGFFFYLGLHWIYIDQFRRDWTS